MSTALRIRLFAFAILAATGIVFVAASYLGVFNVLFGRQVSMYVDLPRSGGLYVGSEVDNRGVKIGKVTDMNLTQNGVRVTIRVNKNADIPVSSALSVADLTAVGEQYLNFSPANSSGPYASPGHVFTGTEANLPETTDQLLMDIDQFVNSVPTKSLQTTVSELGKMFNGNADALGQMVDAGSKFINTASAHEKSTIDLINSSATVLRTQAAHASDIANFASGLANFTSALKVSDPNLRTILTNGGPAIREADGLVNDLSAVVPSFLSNLIPLNQVVTDHLVALEQTLVVLPPVIATGFTATSPNGDGYGHLNMQFDYSLAACSGAGYLPHPWPSALDTSDLPLFPARCNDPTAQPSYTGPGAKLQRGVNMTPPVR